MTSDDEACSSAKKMKTDPPTAHDTVQDINAQFPKIDNLEYFPEKVLLQIFSQVNDIDLLHLSDCSCRFEKLAKFAFKDKYANKCFVFDGDTDSRREMYEELFSRFGRYADIKAVEVKKIKRITENHWLTQLLRQYTTQLLRLTFDHCSIRNYVSILSGHTNIEYLILRSVMTDDTFILPDYDNLKKLELNALGHCYNFANLQRTIRNNPALESLIIWNCYTQGNFSTSKVMMTIVENHMYLRHLTELHLGIGVNDPQILSDAMDSFTDSMKNLRSFKLLIHDRKFKLIQRLGLKCKNLTHLALEYRGDHYFIDGMINALRQFNTIEHFELAQRSYSDRIESVVGHMSNLRHLKLKMRVPNSNTFILSLVRNCPSIQTISIDTIDTVVPLYKFDIKPKFFVDLQFWDEFIQVMEQPNGKVELINFSKPVCYVTKNEIVWDGMVMHWMGCDWSHNKSNVHLLDLAKPMDRLEVAEAVHRSPFDHILGYLDMASLYAISTASKQSKQLVESFVKRHAQQNGMFTITDDFHHDVYGLVAFAEHVEHLIVHISDTDFIAHLRTVEEQYRKLNKLSIRSPSSMSLSNEQYFIFPQIRHLIIDIRCCHLCEISKYYPELETLEIKHRNFLFICCLKPLEFRNLKKFTFSNDVKGVVERVRKTFARTTTTLIPNPQ